MFDKNGDKIVGGLLQRVLIDMPYTLTRLDPPKHDKACDAAHAAMLQKKGQAWPRAACKCPQAKRDYTPQIEAMVKEVIAHPKHGEVAVCRNVESHGLHHAISSRLTVMRGDTKASRQFKATLETGRVAPKRR